MTICARADGRKIKECTRGLTGCICAHEILNIAGRLAYPKRCSEDELKPAHEFAEEIQKNNDLSAFYDT